MKLKYQMTVTDVDGRLIAIPTDCAEEARCILRMNSTMAEILKLLEREITEDEIVAALRKDYDASESQIRSSVQKAIGTLRERALLAE